MAHTVYQTKAYVIKSIPSGEANRRLDLLSEDMGLIRANAQGIRYIKSKLRFALSDFALAEVSLIRGKDYWKIINAVPEEDIFFSLAPAVRIIFIKVFSLISRLVVGEHREPDIFWLIRNAHSFSTSQIKNIDEDNAREFEAIMIFRLLSLLGYIGDQQFIKKYGGEEWTMEILEEAKKDRKRIVEVINHALHHSGL